MSGCKYIIVLGGVFSGTGKGISAASIALLMKMRGMKVQIAKFDPYLNLNAGTMSPGQHGECYLCNDGSETDLDLGHYERITGIEVGAQNIYTGGQLYKELLAEEERGRYLGQTVQMVPHVTGKIIERFEQLGEDQDIVFVEIGGTVGDMESAGFLEASRQFKQKYFEQVMVCLVSPILWVPTIGEFKTKPLQNSVKTLQSFGLQPDILLCRTPQYPKLPKGILDKVSAMTNVHRNAVFEAPDVSTIYQVPIEFWNRHLDDLIVDKLHLKRNGVRIHKYRDLVEKYVNADELPELHIGIVGKYDNCEEAYISLKEALYHSGLANEVRIVRHWISADDLESSDNLEPYLGHLNGVIVPGGFDVRGAEGKIKAIRYCRENKIPFLGICLGLQCAVIEFARNVLNLDCNSQEFQKDTPNPVVHYLEGQTDAKKSGTMRLGSYSCEIEDKNSLAYDLYKKKQIHERHRHRLEVNGDYAKQMEDQGFRVTGKHISENGELIEIMELDRSYHPFFIGTQAHPEFRSRLGSPSPLFYGLIRAGMNNFVEKPEAEDVEV